MSGRCHKRRVDRRQAEAAARALGDNPLLGVLEMQGFAMKPVRAPRELRNGALHLRAVWCKAVDGAVLTVRVNLKLTGPV